MNIDSHYPKKRELSNYFSVKFDDSDDVPSFSDQSTTSPHSGLDERETIFPLTARVWTMTPFRDSMMLR